MGLTPTQVAVETALVDVCVGRTPQVPDDPEAVADFIDAARHHRIAPLAHIALRDSRLEIAAELRGDRDRAMLNHLRMSAQLGRVAQTLDGMAWLVFKGPVLSEFAHPVAGLRFYKDLDLLVAPADFREACHRLFRAGWKVVIGNESLRDAEFPGEVPLVNSDAVVMDLHWSMASMKSVRGRLQLAAGPLLERRIPATIGPAAISVLDSFDTLVHVCLHAALAGGTRLGHILDVDQVARQVSDWDALAERVRQWKAAPEVAAVLGRARRLLGTPAPDDLNSRLGVGPGLARMMELVDRSCPVPRLRADESGLRLFTRSLRPTLPGTIAVVIARATEHVTGRFRPAVPVKPRIPADPEVVEEYLALVDAVAD